ncbi:hypothetical protein LC048_21965 [Mesobacillus subterraneus]|uniref:hypothetical protein n=1 Tax=Mesobacillus subterraneus TaxID=285983 RepID=UPI001CFDD7A1|nr:hypothetical protein [Mesobacillus subterraneus]WLR54986.1 hypothetical protein LC048_21965 [Mesobacillus subterraneus]
MILKHRTESDELKITNFLEPRMNFSEKEKQRHYSLRKGYEGEVRYDAWMTGLEIENLTLNDLLFEMGGPFTKLILLSSCRIPFISNVKHYEGDYYYEVRAS